MAPVNRQVREHLPPDWAEGPLEAQGPRGPPLSVGPPAWPLADLPAVLPAATEAEHRAASVARWAGLVRQAVPVHWD